MGGAFVLPFAFMLQPEYANAQILLDGDNYRGADDPLRDDRLNGVKERFHPELKPAGLDIGGVIVRPELSVAETYVSNLLAVKGGADDVAVMVKPELELVIPTSRFDLSISGWFAVHRYQKRATENNSEYAVVAKAKLPISSGYGVFVDGGHGRFTEPRIAINASINRLKPVQFEKSHAGLQFQKITGRMLLGAQLQTERLDFRETGTVPAISITNRNRDQFTLMASGEYSFSPDTAVWGILRAYRKSGYRQKIRNSEGFELAGGLRFKPSPVFEFSGAFGYLNQVFKQQFRDVNGVTIDARLKWLPTMLTTIGAGFTRKIEDQGSQAQGDFFVSELDVTVDHELRRNLILDLSLGLVKYNLSNNQLANRRFNLILGAQYRPNRNWTISAHYGRIEQSSATVTRRFTQSRLSFSVTVTT